MAGEAAGMMGSRCGSEPKREASRPWPRAWAALDTLGRFAGLVCQGAVFAAGCNGCTPSGPAEITPPTPAGAPRPIRVLLAVSRADCRVHVPGEYVIRNPTGDVLAQGVDLPWTVISGGSGVMLDGDSTGETEIEIVPHAEGTVALSRWSGDQWTPDDRYAGTIRILTQPDGAAKVVNVADVETYLAGVLPGEVYPDFHEEAFVAQSVAARTYALYHMSTRAAEDYDVVATEGSQVYTGVSDTLAHRKARDAVERSRGVVCTWTSPAGERIFCTFYSSACGGMTHAAAEPGSDQRIPPLSGGVKCDYCRIAKGEAYRWNSQTLSSAQLMARLARRYPNAAQMGNLVDLRVLRCGICGRAEKIRIVGERGPSLDLPGERFRLAVGSHTMRSTHCRVRIRGGAVTFEEGRGFGHGWGLCQWGMEGQAQLGRTAAQILRYYYPQSHLTRAY